jgi:phage terminase large subunit
MISQNPATKIRLSEIVGSGYADFWHFRGRYRVVKGGRASKKSTTAALWHIYHMMKHPDANVLVVRKTYNAHKDSTYAQLKWAINRLGVDHLWQPKLSPLEIVYKPTGQKILFRGLDDPMSITSITVEKGYLSWVWVEEAYQVTNEEDFNKLDMSIRGETGELPKIFTLTFNPWNDKHWLKKRFFDAEDKENILAKTTTYRCNEFLGDDDRALFEWMRERSPRRYRIEGLGDWGIAEGAIYENWQEREFEWREIAAQETAEACYGLDFGYSTDPTAYVASIVVPDKRELYLFDEHYQRAMLNTQIATMLKYKGVEKERIIADSAEPKSIDEIRKLGIRHIQPADKGRDSVLNGIQYLQQYTIYVHPKCVNAVTELGNYVWDTKEGQAINKPIDEYNHLMDALRYSVERIQRRRDSMLIKPQEHKSGPVIQPVQALVGSDVAQTIPAPVKVATEVGKMMPVPPEKKMRKAKRPMCPHCNQAYTRQRGASYYCEEHGWQGAVGIPDEYRV